MELLEEGEVEGDPGAVKIDNSSHSHHRDGVAATSALMGKGSPISSTGAFTVDTTVTGTAFTTVSASASDMALSTTSCPLYMDLLEFETCSASSASPSARSAVRYNTPTHSAWPSVVPVDPTRSRSNTAHQLPSDRQGALAPAQLTQVSTWLTLSSTSRASSPGRGPVGTPSNTPPPRSPHRRQSSDAQQPTTRSAPALLPSETTAVSYASALGIAEARQKTAVRYSSAAAGVSSSSGVYSGDYVTAGTLGSGSSLSELSSGPSWQRLATTPQRPPSHRRTTTAPT